MASNASKPESGNSTPRTILVAVAGGSPAIVTETLWALTQQRGERVDEVRVITTSKGEGLIKAALLDPKANRINPGVTRFADCCRECGLPPETTSFTVHTLEKTKGTALADIRDDDENQLAADQICELIRQWTAEANTRLYCSAAGGRKTMSIYLTIAVMLYGRADDRLFHVLVEPEEVERCRDFFHPSRKARTLTYNDGSGKQKTLSTAKIKIDLGEVPFVRLRVLDTSELFGKAQRYSEVAARVQARLEFLARAASSHLRIHPIAFQRSHVPVEVAGRICNLNTAPGFIYALVAEHRRSQHEGGVEVDLIAPRDLKRVYKRLSASDYSDFLEGTEFDFLVKWMRQLNSKDQELLDKFKGAIQVNVHRANESLQKQEFPQRFMIENVNLGKRGTRSQGAMYTINLPGDAIHLPSL